MESILDRVKKIIELKNISISRLEAEIGMSNSSLRKTLKKGKGMNTDTLEKILMKFPDVNPQWLILGEGEMLLSPLKINYTPGIMNLTLNEYREKYGDKHDVEHLKDKYNGLIDDLNELITKYKKEP